MGYSKARSAVERVLPILNELYYKRQTVSLAASDSVALAYKLREAIYASQFHKDLEHLTGLKTMYEFRQMPGRVMCSFLGVDHSVVPALYTEEAAAPAEEVKEFYAQVTPIRSEEPEPSKMQLPDVETLHGVVGAVLRFGGTHEEIYFPDALLTEEEKEKLLSWCESSDAEWGFIDHETAGITLTRAEIAEELLWTGE